MIKKITLPLIGLMLCSIPFVANNIGNAAEVLPKDPSPFSKFPKVATFTKEKCMACHTRNYDLPVYAMIPGIKGIIEKDYKDGLRALNINDEFEVAARGKPISEPTLAKMEWVIENNTMPPAKFAAVHWGSRVSADDRANVLEWVRISRARYYNTHTASKEHANEPLQPLPEFILVNDKKVAFGQKLFNDKRLSGDDTVSCASCHALDKAGTGNARFSEGVRKQLGDINAPTVFNSTFNVRQFWNGRAANLEEQAGGPPFNPVEMDSKDWNQIIGKLATDDAFMADFKEIYPGELSGDKIANALAEYEKTLITPNSRFDKWLRGDKAALNRGEVEGYMRFKAYRCASCHVGKSVGGQSFEYMDLKKNYFADRGNPLASDEGLKAFTKKDDDLHKFKVPTLRNIELTAPYLHDGTVTTLDETIRLMGIYLSGVEVLPGDRKLITDFLRTLTGEYQGKKVEGIAVER